MNSECLIFTPLAGWASFARGDDLAAHIAAKLKSVGSGGIWRYYGFTAWNSIWSSDSSAINDLYLSFSSSPTEHPARIEELVVVRTDDQSEHFKQLQSLVGHFSRDFELTVSYDARNA